MFCTKCGNQLPEIAKFCGKCGTQVGNETKSPAAPPPNGTTYQTYEPPVQKTDTSYQPAQQQNQQQYHILNQQYQQPAQQPQPPQQAAQHFQQPERMQQPVYNTGNSNNSYNQQLKKKKGKGCLVTFIVILAIIILISVVAILNGGEFNFNFSTASVSKLQTASAINPDTSEPLSVTSVFSKDTPVIYLTGIMRFAPKGTSVKSVWIYLDSGASLEGPSVAIEGSRRFNFSLTKPDNGFVPGTYEAKIYVDGKEKKSIQFQVQ